MKSRAGSPRGCNGWRAALALLCLFFLPPSQKAHADDVPPPRSARLSYLAGNVTVERMDNTGSDPAQLNMPLTEGLRLTTAEDGQAEVEFEDGSLLRLTPNTALLLTALSVDGSGNYQTQLSLLHGLAYAVLRATPKFAYNLIVADDVISPTVNTTVRVAFDQPPPAISVLDGTVHVEQTGTQSYRTDVRAGETLTSDPSASSRYLLTQQIEQNSWDNWNESRDQAAADESADRTAARDTYAGDDGYGWSDLDANGNWYDVPGEGRVWQPTVGADPGFDPYGYGSWVASPSAGYVWASGYSWGWTPFRCGNWSYWNDFGWGWVPGSGCGIGGRGFGRAGYSVNISRPPLHYPFHSPPVRKPGQWHHIPVGHPGRGASPNLPDRIYHGPRTIAGQTVQPLRPVGGGYTPRGGSAIGSSLRRDFPVDRTNHQPVLGATTAPAPGTMPANNRPVNNRPAQGWRPIPPASTDSRMGYGTAPPAGQPPQPSTPGQPMRPPPPGMQRPNPDQSLRPSSSEQNHLPSRTWTPPPAPESASRPAPSQPVVARPIPQQQQRYEAPSRPMPSPMAPRSAPPPPSFHPPPPPPPAASPRAAPSPK